MNKRELLEYKKKLSELSKDEDKKRKLHLREIANGTKLGPIVGYPSIDKPWLGSYSVNDINYESGDMNATIAEVMANYAQNNPNVITTSFNSINRTAKQDIEKGNKIARALKEYGIGNGDIVAVSVPCIPEFRYLFYAINKVGATSQWLDFRTSENELIDCLNEANPKLIFTFNGVCEKVNSAVRKHNEVSINKVQKNIEIYPSDTIIELPIAKVLRLKESISKEKDNSFEKYTDFLLKGENKKEFPPEKIDNDQTIAIVYTGGTTGSPKGVEFTNKNFNAIVKGYTLNYSSKYLKTGDKFLIFIPPWTAYGLSMDYNAFNKGYITEYLPKLNPATIDETLLQSKPQFFAGVPKNVDTLSNSTRIKPNTDISFIKVPAIGADSINPNIEKKVNKFFHDHNCPAEVVKGYGMTEGCATVATTDFMNNKISSVGRPFIDNVLAIKDPDTGDELPYNEIGEICYAGPSVMKGYYKNEEATDNALENDIDGITWMHSGDLGYIDTDGYLFLVGRLKKMFVRSGFKIFSSVIEEAIGSHPAVKECVAVGVPDAIEGHVPVVNIVINDSYNNYSMRKLVKEFNKIAKNNLFEYYLPLEYAFVNSLDYTKNGKVDFVSMTKKSEEFIKTKKKK